MTSIITINFNNFNGLIQTIKSVQSQTNRNFEHIIIDGNSKDGSKEYLSSCLNLFKIVISENDNGIYHAMNKGLLYAEGDHVLFLNSGDVFDNENVLKNALLNEKKDILVFGMALLSNNRKYPNNTISKKWLYFNLPNHQTMFFPKSFYKYNKYNENFKVVGDSEYKFRAFSNCKYEFLNIIICNFNENGVSNDYSTFNKFKLILNESINAAKPYRNHIYMIYKFITHSIKFIKHIKS